MSPIAITETSTEVPPTSTLKLKLNNLPQSQRPGWYTELQEQGWTVVKGCIAKEKADRVADKMYEWVEKFGLGFDRNDPSTRKKENLHFFYKGGLTNGYGVAHEQFMWDVKQDPDVVQKFEEIWGTDELLVSFDGCNISIPLPDRKPNDDVFAQWAHVDQSPLVTDLYCVQGIINIAPNGPEDGGTMVLKGSAKLYKELFDAFEDRKPERGWNTRDRHDYSDEQLQWLLDHGCEWHKICADPGDLILWDSRTVHYGATPTSTNDRLAIYCCYKPASVITPEIASRRREAWHKKLNSTHDPKSFMCLPRKVPSEHHTHKESCERALQEPVLTERGRQLVGLDPYPGYNGPFLAKGQKSEEEGKGGAELNFWEVKKDGSYDNSQLK